MKDLPILAHEEEIVQAVMQNQVTIVVGETGSGKTTQVPIFLYHAGLSGNGMIGILEPRRIAATSTAAFVANQLGGKLGATVGYQIRFDAAVAEETKVKFMTVGILLREFQADPNLKKYSVIMVDEAHERSRDIDFALGLLKDLLQRRSDLRIVVASATIDEKKFSRYFGDAPIINVSGRMFPVQEIYHDYDVSPEGMPEVVVRKVLEIHDGGQPGDILVFMPGKEDINRTIDELERANLPDLIPLAIYGALSPDRQARIFERFNGRRKVVVATNIAETTITIDGIVHVVDSGMIKQMEFDPVSGIQQLDTRLHSQAGCEQRKGRAGRTQEGICHRMYTAESFLNRPQFTTPEILRTSLAGVILTMIDIGIKEIEDFDFIDSPDRESFREAYQTLVTLGAVSSDRKRLTELGRSMAKLPLEPRIARMLLEAQRYGCIKEVATIAAFLSVRNVFFLPRKEEERYMARQMHERFKSRESDTLTFLKVWEGYKASGFDQDWCIDHYLNSKTLQEVAKVREQLFAVLTQVGMEISESGDSDAIAKAVAAGLISNLLEHHSRFSYDAVLREACGNIFIHPGSSLFGVTPRLLVAAEIIETKKVYASNCTAVKPEWLPDLLPHLCSLGDLELQSYTPGESHVVGRRQIIFNGTTYGYKEEKVSLEKAIAIQNKKITEAHGKGLIRLSFIKTTDSIGLTVFVSHSGDRTYKTFSSARIEEGKTYYCEAEDFLNLGRWYAKPVFEILNLGGIPIQLAPPPAPKEKTPVAEKPFDMKTAMANLSQKWGATVGKLK